MKKYIVNENGSIRPMMITDVLEFVKARFGKMDIERVTRYARIISKNVLRIAGERKNETPER